MKAEMILRQPSKNSCRDCPACAIDMGCWCQLPPPDTCSGVSYEQALEDEPSPNWCPLRRGRIVIEPFDQKGDV